MTIAIFARVSRYMPDRLMPRNGMLMLPLCLLTIITKGCTYEALHFEN